MKKFLSLILTASIILSVFPVQVFAEGAVQNSYNINISSDSWQDLAESDSLFDGFIMKQAIGDIGLFGTNAREYLNSVEQSVYDKLKALITRIAHNGGLAETTFAPTDFEGLVYSWPTGTDVMAAFESQVSLYNVWTALVHDCPYELYWFDKNREGASVGFTTNDDGANVSITQFTVLLPVSLNWRSNPTYTTTVTSDVSKVKLAVENAVYIADKYASKDDYTKMEGFKNEICNLVDYNNNEVIGGTEYINNSSWQMINVFDEDPATKALSDGYAKAFQYLCDTSEFDNARCYTIKGTVSGEDYMWNIVTMEDGKTYLVDIAITDQELGKYGQYFFAGYDDGGRWSGFVVNDRRYAYHSNNNLFDIELLILADKDYFYQPKGTLYSGQCGDNAYWHLNENGTLTIQGWGDMWSEYTIDNAHSYLPPWHDYVKDIKNIVVKPGITSIGDYRFYLCQYAQTATIPDTVTSIGRMAFYSCMALKELTVPDSVTQLNEGSFGNCTSLEKITLSKNITSIPAWLLNSAAITEIVIPDGVTDIGNNAFYLCNNLKEITLPVELNTIGESAFNTYPSNVMEKVYYKGTATQWGNIVIGKYNDNLQDANVYFTNEKMIVRIKGETRYETSFAIAEAMRERMGVEKFENIIITSGLGYADALSGSYLAKVKGAPILMTSGKDSNIADIQSFVQSNLKSGGTVYILGGTAAVNQKTEDTLKGINGVSVKRLKGKNRYLTNIEILKEAGVTNEDILVATGANFADSLSASAAGKPILLVDGKKTLSADQKAYLNSLSTNKLYILGGTGAVGENYESELAAYGSVERVKGKSRYETSVAIAEKFFASPDYAVIAYAENFPDGLCGGPLSTAMNAPLILTKTGNQSAAKSYVQRNNIKNGTVLGGASLIDDNTAMDIFGVTEIKY